MPPLVPDGTFTVMVEVCVPEIDVGLKLTVGPLGDTAEVSATVPLNPPLGVKDIEEVSELPGAIESDEDEALNVKPGVDTPASASMRPEPLGLPHPVARS